MNERAKTYLEPPADDGPPPIADDDRWIVPAFDTVPPDPPPEDILLGDAWLCREEMNFFVSLTGEGKSVFFTQAACCWSLGLPYCGITVPRPLRILTVVGEDTRNTLSAIVHGLELAGDATVADVAQAQRDGRLVFDTWTASQGYEHLTGRVGPLMDKHAADLLLVSPLLSFIGGPIVEVAPTYLRSWLHPMLQERRAGALVASHTTKPPNADGAQAIITAYASIGGSEVANVPRSTMLLMPHPKAIGYSRLTVAKRRHVGWRDEDGRYCDQVWLARSDDPRRPHWRQVGEDEVLDAVEDAAATATNGRVLHVFDWMDQLLANTAGGMEKGTLVTTAMNAKVATRDVARDLIRIKTAVGGPWMIEERRRDGRKSAKYVIRHDIPE